MTHNSHTARWIVVLTLAAGACQLAPAPVSAVASNAQIKTILSERIDFYESGVSMVVGVVGPEGRRIIAHGAMDRASGRPVDGDTIFDLASTTKGFTALLLADMVVRGEVKLDDAVSKYLPPEIKIPIQSDGRTVSLLDLATFYSGLPRDLELNAQDPRNPFAQYTMAQLQAFMAALKPSANIGSRFGYSNLGYNLLGEALSQRAGLSYEELVKQRILDPLGMKDTGVIRGQEAPPEFAGQLASGYDKQLTPTPHLEHRDGFMGAGALSASASDMLDFLEAMIGLRETPLDQAFAELLQVRRPTNRPDTLVGLGWGITQREGQTIIWRAGGHPGFSSWVGYDPASRSGVVVLSNSAAADTTDVGFHLLNPHNPLQRGRKKIELSPAALDALAGRYRFADGTVLVFKREEDHLAWTVEGQPPRVPVTRARSAGLRAARPISARQRKITLGTMW